MRTTFRIVIATVMTVAIAYTLAGFLLVPHLLRGQIIDDLSERTEGTVTLGQLSVNPFLLSVDLSQTSIEVPDKQEYFTLESMHARVDVASLWRRGWVVREMVFDAPHLRLAALPDWHKESDSAPIFFIGHLQFRRGQLHWTGPTSATAANAMIDLTDLEITLENLGGEQHTPGQFTLAAVVNRSGWLRSSGSLRPFPGSLDATLELGDLNLADLDSMIPADRGFGRHLKVLSALLSGEFDVNFQHGRASIRGQAGLDQLELVDRSNNSAIFSAVNVEAMDLAIQPAPFGVSMEVLQLNQPHLRLARDADGSLHGGYLLKAVFDQSEHFRPSFRRIEIQQGLLALTDRVLAPSYQLKTDRLEGNITRQGDGTQVSVTGHVMGGGRSVLGVNWSPTGSDGDGHLDITLENLDAVVLSPYLEAVTGRGIASGQLDMRIDYQADDQQFELKNEISVLGFQLDEVPVGPVTPGLPLQLPLRLSPQLQPQLPLDLAVALVRDRNDLINISIPVPAGRIEEKMQLGGLVSEGFVKLVQSLTRTPFYTLGKLNGISPPNFERVLFMPGNTALPMPAQRNLAILASALEHRPGLGLKINGRFDTVIDRQALARKQVGLHVALASTAGPPGREAPDSIDFDDSKVVSVLEEFAEERLSTAELQALRSNHPQRDPAFYSAVFEALVKNEAVSRTKLKALARYRAQAIVDQLKAAGIDPQRLQIGKEIETAFEDARLVFVELEIVML